VFNNYGPKQNGELLLGYGFAIPDNPLEQVAINIRLPSHGILDVSLVDVPFGIDQTLLSDGGPHYLRTAHHPLGRYESDIAVFRGFPPYVVYASFMMAVRCRDIYLADIDRRDLRERLVLATLLFLYRAVQDKCRERPYPYVTDTSFPSVKQKYASIYRDGQAKVWHSFRRELKAVLESLRSRGDGDFRLLVAAEGILTVSEALKMLRYVRTVKLQVLHSLMEDNLHCKNPPAPSFSAQQISTDHSHHLINILNRNTC
jgi:hypothetical protein